MERGPVTPHMAWAEQIREAATTERLPAVRGREEAPHREGKMTMKGELTRVARRTCASAAGFTRSRGGMAPTRMPWSFGSDEGIFCSAR